MRRVLPTPPATKSLAPGQAYPSERINRLLFDYEYLTREAKIELCDGLPQKVIRWIGANHPDNWSRKLFYELTGVPVGEGTVLNMGLVLYDAYEGLARFGSRVAVAHNVTIVCDSNPNNSDLSALPYVAANLLQKAPVTVDDDAWIGCGAIILPGVTIGKFSIVGAGAVVTRDVPPYSIAAGSPARIVRMLRSRKKGSSKR